MIYDDVVIFCQFCVKKKVFLFHFCVFSSFVWEKVTTRKKVFCVKTRFFLRSLLRRMFVPLLLVTHSCCSSMTSDRLMQVASADTTCRDSPSDITVSFSSCFSFRFSNYIQFLCRLIYLFRFPLARAKKRKRGVVNYVISSSGSNCSYDVDDGDGCWK